MVMRYIRNLILSIILISCSVLSCIEKKCQNIPVGSLSCDAGFESFSDAISDSKNHTELRSDIWMNHSGNYKITDSIAYDSVFRYRPFGDLNFNEWILVGIVKLTSPGSELVYKTIACLNKSEQKIKLKVSYSLYDQCRGSGIDDILLSIWIRVPRSYINYQIGYDLVDINPFPK
jgi:hypothetical protein